jgi:FMN phosphatase YigB (HAD superfamily)
LFLSQEWEIAPQSIVYVGDQDVDRSAALEAGCQFVPANQMNHIWHLPDRCEPANPNRAQYEIGRRDR